MSIGVQWTQWTHYAMQWTKSTCSMDTMDVHWVHFNVTSIVSVHGTCPICPLNGRNVSIGHQWTWCTIHNDVQCTSIVSKLVQWTQSTFLQSLFSKGSVGMLTVSIEPMQWTQWTSNANGRQLDIIMNCPSCPLVSNEHNGHIVSIQWTKWTCSMDTMDVHWVHFIVSYGPTHCWLHFNLLIGHFVLILFNGNNVSIVCTVSIAHSGHNAKSTLHNRRPMDTMDLRWNKIIKWLQCSH